MAYPLLIKTLTFAGFGYLTYELYGAYKQEKRIRKLQAMKQYQIQSGQQVNPEIEQELDKIMNEHYGQKVLERMSTRSVFEDQITMQIQAKRDLREKLREEGGSENQLKKLEEDIQKLEELYSEVKKNKAPEYEEYTTMK